MSKAMVLCALIFSLCLISVHSQVGSSCTSRAGKSGTCINTASSRCGGELHTGRCAGAANIRCCVPPAGNGGGNEGVGSACTSEAGSRGTCINTINSRCGGQIHTGRCPGADHVRCCVAAAATPNNGGNNGGNGGSVGGGGDISSYPSSLSANGYTYTGRKAQVLHFLRARFGASATTYASHSDGPTNSADLWTQGATGGRDNRGIPSMNSLADYCAANTRLLGLKYVIWKQRINSGDSRGWRNMADRGSLTQNHFDHVHITFTGSASATVAEQQTFSTTSADSTSTPGWAIGMIVIAVICAIGAIVAVVLLGRKISTMYE